jgi:hypothetical protein
VDVSDTANQPRHFYRVPKVRYHDLYTPTAVSGCSLALNISGAGTVVYALAASGNGGTCSFTPTSGSPSTGAVIGHQWLQAHYIGRLYVESQNVVPIYAELDFVTPSAGTFRGTAYTSQTGTSIFGTFTFTRP